MPSLVNFCKRSIVESVSIKDSCAWVARGDAFSNATGLRTNSPLPTTQSRAFFNTPGTPCAYSGLEINTPSAWPVLIHYCLLISEIIVCRDSIEISHLIEHAVVVNPHRCHFCTSHTLKIKNVFNPKEVHEWRERIDLQICQVNYDRLPRFQITDNSTIDSLNRIEGFIVS